MLKSFFILTISILPFLGMAQKQIGMEQYYYWQQTTNGIIVPKIFYQSPKNWYAEFRYNYEEVNTASLHFGKKFSFKKIKSLEITPMVGIMVGKLRGSSAGALVEFSIKKFSFSSEPQFVFSFHEKYENYIYSWSEVSYEVFSFLYTGLALQQTKSYSQTNVLEPGIMAGFCFKNFDIPIYCFNPTSAYKNFVMGVNWRWEK